MNFQDNVRYHKLAAKAEAGIITQAELDEAQRLVVAAARDSREDLQISPPVTAAEKWTDRVIAEKLQSGDLPNLGYACSDIVKAAQAVIAIADRKLFVRDRKSARKIPMPNLPIRDRNFWLAVNKRASDVVEADDSIFDLDLSPFAYDANGYLIPLSQRFRGDIRHNPVGDGALPPGFEGFDAPTEPVQEDPLARFRHGLFHDAMPGDLVTVGSLKFIIQRIFSPYAAMAKKVTAKSNRKMWHISHGRVDLAPEAVIVQEQKGTPEATDAMPVVMMDTFDNVLNSMRRPASNPAARAGSSRRENDKLYQRLLSLRGHLAKAAQSVYDEWGQDEQGLDPELGAGGICQDIAEAMAGILADAGIDARTVDSHGVGEQHVWVQAWNDKEAYDVDIPYTFYERGGGYSWSKLPDVAFKCENVYISPLDRDDFNFEDEDW